MDACICFFFQAEDGIRDVAVTGVQTCALPISVAHNEMYRKLIKGYMQRHKVKPGITGWAQVNGQRGETETLEQMKARIDYDLDYLRNWSLRLDLYIIAKTVWVVLRGKNAY